MPRRAYPKTPEARIPPSKTPAPPEGLPPAKIPSKDGGSGRQSSLQSIPYIPLSNPEHADAFAPKRGNARRPEATIPTPPPRIRAAGHAHASTPRGRRAGANFLASKRVVPGNRAHTLRPLVRPRQNRPPRHTMPADRPSRASSRGHSPAAYSSDGLARRRFHGPD